MRKRTDGCQNVNFSRELLIGLGESSVRKNYYPELQKRLGELERFRLLLDQALDAILLLDGAGCIVDANVTACSYCGCSKAELIGNPVGDWLDFPAELNLTNQTSNCQSAARSADCELYCQSGRTVPVEVTTNRVELQDGVYLIILARDITERKQAAEHHMALHEELYANYEELQSLYKQVSVAEESLRGKVAELEESQAALAESESRYRLAMEGANDAIWDWDIRRNQWTISNRWAEMLGLSPGKYGGYIAYLDAHIHPDDVYRRQKAIEAHMAGKTDYYEAEYRVKLPSGKWIWILSKGKILFDETNTPIRMCGSYTDVTERKCQEEQLAYNAYHDSLTGLHNRLSFKQQVASIATRAQPGNANGAVFLMDLDNFKLVNDSWGHTVGDKLLQEIANRLQSLNLPGLTACRFGGDEFVAVLSPLEHMAVDACAERILELFDKPAVVNDNPLPLSVSIGIAVIYNQMTPDDVLRQADIALHEAKAAGKRTWRMYESQMQTAILQRMRLEQELRQALAEEQFLLYYQPQYDLSGRPIAVEALLRWKHPKRGMVPPLSFISVAEENGLIEPIGEWVIRSACRFGRRQLDHQKPLRVAVNVSARQLMQEDFTQRLCTILAEEKYPTELFEIEITETILMDSFDSNVQKLRELRALGIRIALDDFGSGYSSLTYLSRLPIDTLKIDKAFIDDSGKRTNAAIIGIIIQLAHELKLSVVAEGVETAEQLAALCELKCDYLQGYLTSPPQPPEVIEEMARTMHSAFKNQ